MGCTSDCILAHVLFRYLTLNSNFLTGSIPTSIGALQALVYVVVVIVVAIVVVIGV